MPKAYFDTLIAANNLPNLLLVVVGLGATFFAWKTLRAVRDQVQVMKDQNDTAIARDRPRLSLEIKDFNFGDVPTIAYELTCHGGSPAFIQSTWESIHVWPIADYAWPKEAMGFPIKDVPSVLTNQTLKGFEYILGEDGILTDESAAEAFRSGGLYLHFRIRIEFTDIYTPNPQDFVVSRVYGIPTQITMNPMGEMLQKALGGSGMRISEWKDSRYKYGQDEYRSDPENPN